MAVRERAQLAFDEQAIEDAALENALELRKSSSRVRITTVEL